MSPRDRNASLYERRSAWPGLPPQVADLFGRATLMPMPEVLSLLLPLVKPTGVYTALSVALLLGPWSRGQGFLMGVVLVFLGFVLWTLVYYVIHRWALHRKNTPAWIRRLEDHYYHHQVPDDRREYPYRLKDTLPRFGAMALLLGALLWPFGRSHAVAPLMSGYVLGNLVFEWVHFCAHTEQTHRYPWVRLWVRQHLKHHFKNPSSNYGTVTPFWDFVFRSYRP